MKRITIIILLLFIAGVYQNAQRCVTDDIGTHAQVVTAC